MSVSVEKKPTSGRGDLAGYKLHCSECGMDWTTSVDPTSEVVSHEHYHMRKKLKAKIRK